MKLIYLATQTEYKALCPLIAIPVNGLTTYAQVYDALLETEYTTKYDNILNDHQWETYCTLVDHWFIEQTKNIKNVYWDRTLPVEGECNNKYFAFFTLEL